LDPLRTTGKYYAVRRGRTNNVIYVSWALCKSQVLNYPGAEFKAFNTYKSALEYLGAARQTSEGYNRQAHFNAGSNTTSTSELAATVDASTQTTKDRGLRVYIEGIALGFIVGAIATLWILPQL
jgi:viroplasmin and RNaseH domain-containing protein